MDKINLLQKTIEVLATGFNQELKLKLEIKEKSNVYLESGSHAAYYFRTLWDADDILLQEQFCVVFLNANNGVIGHRFFNTGTRKSVQVDIAMIYSTCLLCHASRIIIAHNHPSGKLRPSVADKGMTDNMKYLAQRLDIELLDHIIITADNYSSFAEMGLMWMSKKRENPYLIVQD